jgi:hypothetical protein
MDTTSDRLVLLGLNLVVWSWASKSPDDLGGHVVLFAVHG